MKAMILAAGLGTRLRPLTNDRPKALVEIAGRTLLEITLARLKKFGVREVIINVHHFADNVINYLKANHNFGMQIEVSREDVLLDTGGGLKKAGWFFQNDTEPFILHNVDVISTIDLERMLQFHKERQAVATLAVQERKSSRYLLFNEELQLCGRKVGEDKQLCSTTRQAVTQKPNITTEARRHGGYAEDIGRGKQGQKQQPEESRRPRTPKSPRAAKILSNSNTAAPDRGELQPLAFSGIHVISPRLFPLMKEEGIFPIIDSYLRLAGEGEKILAFRADQYYWRDVGKVESVARAAEELTRSAAEPKKN